MIKAEDNIALKSNKSLYDIASNTDQYFWHTETGSDTGAHITEIPKDEFLADPANGGGNLLARSNGIAVRDGLEELASFGADGMRIGKTDEKHIEVTASTFGVYDDDGSTPFLVSTDDSEKTRPVGRFSYVSATSGARLALRIYLIGSVEDSKLYFGASDSEMPTDFSQYVTLPASGASATITVNGVECYARYVSSGIIEAVFRNTTSIRKSVGVRYTERYRETYIKVNDASFNHFSHHPALIDATGAHLDNGFTINTYGKIASIMLTVYNTAKVIKGGLVYQGKLYDFFPVVQKTLAGFIGSQPSVKLVGRMSTDGTIILLNNSGVELTTSSSQPITLCATYIFQ